MTSRSRTAGLKTDRVFNLKFKLEDEPREYLAKKDRDLRYYGRNIKSYRFRNMARRAKVTSSFERVKSKEWPEDMQPSLETITRAESLWNAVQSAVLKLDLDAPNISAAEDNSVDVFWGNRKNRVLLNIPSSPKEMLFLHLINNSGQTVINFTDSHSFNVANLLREMRGALD